MKYHEKLRFLKKSYVNKIYSLSFIKTQIIDLFLKSQEQASTTIVSLTAEMKRLNGNFQRLESDVSG